jgi:hypothetical protein
MVQTPNMSVVDYHQLILCVQGLTLAAIGFLFRMVAKISRVIYQHDMMWTDYAKKHGMLALTRGGTYGK